MSIIKEKTDYVNGNAIDAEVINDVVETAINANNVATNIGSNVDISEIGNVGTPSVSITTEGHLKFSSLKGETGAKGEKGNKGDTGNNGLDGSSTIIKAFKNYDAGTTYKNNKDELDLVQYGGSTYAPLSTEGIVNILPTNGSYWQLIASAGASAGGNVASTNNDTLDTNVSYAFKPTNNPTTASGALNGIWQPISFPDTSVYVLKNQGTSNSSKVVMTNENGFIQDTFRSISDSVSSSNDLASCKAVYDYTYSKSDIDSKNTATLSSANTYTDKQSMELGYYDTITANDDGSYTITRQTGYLTINAEDINRGTGSSVNGGGNAYCFSYFTDKLANIFGKFGNTIGISSNGYRVRKVNDYWIDANNISINDNQVCIGFSSEKTQAEIQAMCPIFIQYKLATSTNEKVEKNHFARYNERFILEHNKQEAERSAYEGKVVHESELNNKQDKLVSGSNIKTINDQSIVGAGNIKITEGLFTLVGEFFEEFTIEDNGTYFITSTSYAKIYVADKADTSFYGNAIITKLITGISDIPHIAINGVAYPISLGKVRLLTSGYMTVYKKKI